VLSLVFHAFTAMFIGSILVVLLVAVASSVLQGSGLKSLVDAGGFLNPFFWIPGIVVGFLIARSVPRRTACWVSVAGVIWLAFGTADSLRHYDPRWHEGCSAGETVVNAFFIGDSAKCAGGESTLAGMFFTLPAVNSVAYAVGAWLSLRFPKKQSKRA
jgi:hypothetical protein